MADELARAFVAASSPNARLSEARLARLSYVWDEVVLRGNAARFRDPNNDAYRRAGSLVSGCYPIFTILLALAAAIGLRAIQKWGRSHYSLLS
jgi:hypothetical protein